MAALAEIAAALAAEGVAVSDAHLPAGRIRELIGCCGQRRRREEFSPACVGAQAHRRRLAEMRGDLICWLTPPLFPAERALLEDLEKLRVGLNRRLFLGLFDLELHYAWYPPGAGYARHVDQLQGRDRRAMSFVIYLNEHWPRDAGGELRFFDETGQRDIAPLAGRLVCFQTDGREHSVLAARRDRLSITGWFGRRDVAGVPTGPLA
ncbi:MAG: 2OG-Fe(II) oxygenase [Steroidobacteraceae bacterium]